MDAPKSELDLHFKEKKAPLTLKDKIEMDSLKFAQGMGCSLRYANELWAVQHGPTLHQDVLRGKLGVGNGFSDMFGRESIFKNDSTLRDGSAFQKI